MLRPPSADRCSRRGFLAAAGAGAALSAAPRGLVRGEEDPAAPVALYVIGDTHFLARREAPGELEPASAEVCGRLVDVLNALPGTEIPAEAGGGRVAAPRGLIHAGDILDTGDKQGAAQSEMQATEWAAFTAEYGLTGEDGRLRCPVYEVFGNHDAPHGQGLALDGIRDRNGRRPGVVHVSDNGLHYSWDWGPVHFVNLGLIVGTDRGVDRRRRYDALDSLDFLRADLAEHAGDGGRPVVVTHHVDVLRYAQPCDAAAPMQPWEWDPCDVAAYYEALQGRRVAAIFYGHTHRRQIFRWDGGAREAEAGLAVFNTDNASHFAGDAQAFYYVEIDAERVLVREYATRDRWQTGGFTPQTWSAPLPPA